MAGFLLLIVWLAQCGDGPGVEVEAPGNTYAGLSDSVGYVGIQVCGQCHTAIYNTFMHTGMGSSFGKADTAKSIGDFRGTSVYDPHLNMHYKPYWQNDTDLYLQEFRLIGGDTSFSRKQLIDYVVGSGQHTNSHIYQENDFYYQAPFTWYAQKEKLDLPPGYEEGGNNRFERPIGLECMSCHNAMPVHFKTGSYNKFTKMPQGIDCERCHGPGEAHVKQVSRGDLVDTATQVDYSIVNPKKLSTQLQFEICQRCHLQGNAVLEAGKSFFSFKPGMALSEVMDVYLPRYEQGEDQFIMASHADRFKLSSCYKQSEGAFTCISCHNPHVSIQTTNVKAFNNTCVNCHNETGHEKCSASEAALVEADYNCVSCHMPSSGSTDIPHVTVHDHYIRKPVAKKKQALGRFLGLQAINNEHPGLRSRILAYLQQFERFSGEAFMLDSAALLLERYEGKDRWALKVHMLSLRRDFNEIAKLVERIGSDILLTTYNEQDTENRDAWTHYRLGDALSRSGYTEKALPFFEKAVTLAPDVFNFREKLAAGLQKLGRSGRAEKEYREVLQSRSTHKTALNNLGYLYVKRGEFKLAKEYLTKCVQYHPDYEQAWLNLAQLGLLEKNVEDTEKALREVLRINPHNQKASLALENLTR